MVAPGSRACFRPLFETRIPGRPYRESCANDRQESDRKSRTVQDRWFSFGARAIIRLFCQKANQLYVVCNLSLLAAHFLTISKGKDDSATSPLGLTN